MTPIRATEHVVDRDAPSRWASRLDTTIGNFGSLGARPWAEVSKIEFLPSIRVGDPEYVVPENWVPPGQMRLLSVRTRKPRIEADGLPHVVAAWDESIRRSLFALALPHQTKKGVRRYKPSTWLTNTAVLLRMATWSAANRPSPDGHLWSHLTRSDWAALRTGVSGSSSTQKLVGSLAERLQKLGLRGVIRDFPTFREDPEQPSDGGPAREKSRRGQPVATRTQKTEPRSYQPFSDAFVSELIRRARWLHDNLAPQILQCWESLREATERARKAKRASSHPSIIEERRAIIAGMDWHDADGRPLTRLPWPITIRESRRSITTDVWPPKDPSAINMMVSLLQALNFCTANFCAGGRSSEILDANDQSIGVDGEGRLRARTFKLIDQLDGQARDWPLHPAAMKALSIQHELARIVRPGDATHLWVLLKEGTGPAGSPLHNINEAVIRAVEALGLTHATGGIRPHSHRWRHTVARIVALSLVAAPQVLMDLFGHRDLEMTLRYMLSHPEIASEVKQVAEEVAYALAAEALKDAESGNAGGPAAAPLQIGLERLKMRWGKDALDADTLGEAIDILTCNEKPWSMVRPGVLCTKAVGQYGPCTQGRGSPDPGACRTDCGHRLEMARAKHQCEGALTALLNEHVAAAAEGEELRVASLEGQILATLKRWDDVRDRCIARNETARRIWDTRQGAQHETA
ncbi:integrase [Microvirga sp. 3-52]|uniref:integrase n=1 Tax=Microvirga sp. 3-52 TaxID=2792425 RepID=UPI001ACE7478|nr:integrase [Microvirga sp. 3-52]MBO1905300.1 integrase [Microvirga sp. 3-52]MBS7452611.1 integrase [Microvirga sp. 3-52]